MALNSVSRFLRIGRSLCRNVSQNRLQSSSTAAAASILFFKDFHCLLNKEFERLGGDHCETMNVVTCWQEIVTFNFREFSKEWLILLLDQFLSDLDHL